MPVKRRVDRAPVTHNLSAVRPSFALQSNIYKLLSLSSDTTLLISAAVAAAAAAAALLGDAISPSFASITR